MQTIALSLIAATLGSAQAMPAAADSAAVAAPYPMPARAFRSLAGVYDLADGRVATVFSEQGHYFIQIGAAPRTEIVATGAQAFAGRDRALRVEFELTDESVRAMRLSYRP